MLRRVGIDEAAQIIRNGGIVAFPTETFYGLAVNPFHPEALARLFAVKGRPVMKPILVLVEEPGVITRLTSTIPPAFNVLMASFWPGPLTLVFPAKPEIPSLLTGATSTVGIRISSHPVAQELVRITGLPITATSANLSGQPSASSADEVAAMFDNSIDAVVDGGKTTGGKSSTIVAEKDGQLILVRDGVLPFSEINPKNHP